MAALVIATSALAQSVPFAAQLKGTNEVPSIQSPGSGTAVATFEPATRKLSWTIVFSGMTGPAFAMHFHGPSDDARNSGIALPISGNLASPVKGSATLTESQASELMAGQWYLNIHTAGFPAGELRGQMLIDKGLAAASPNRIAQPPAADDAAAKAAAERAAQEAAAKAAAERVAQEAAAKAAAERVAQEAAAKAAAERAAQEAAAKAAAERAARDAATKAAAARPSQEAAATVAGVPRDAKVCQTDLSNVTASNTVVFNSGSASITSGSRDLLTRVNKIIASCPKIPIEVAGHTDAVGSEARNKVLSQRRAQAVVDYLVKAGVPPDQLVAVGYGSSKPIAANDAKGRAKNRRIEFVVK
jgi:outer membrane protein OmpA-like peptidoglycan-associated protein